MSAPSSQTPFQFSFISVCLPVQQSWKARYANAIIWLMYTVSLRCWPHAGRICQPPMSLLSRQGDVLRSTTVFDNFCVLPKNCQSLLRQLVHPCMSKHRWHMPTSSCVPCCARDAWKACMLCRGRGTSHLQADTLRS